MLDWSAVSGEEGGGGEEDDVSTFRGILLLPSSGLFQQSPGNKRNKLEQKFGTQVAALTTPTPDARRLHDHRHQNYKIRLMSANFKTF